MVTTKSVTKRLLQRYAIIVISHELLVVGVTAP